MYQKEKNPWLKHLDFIILDIICLQIAYSAAYMIRHGLHMPYSHPNYRNLAVVIVFVQLCTCFFLESYRSILRRGYIEELKKTVINVSVVIMTIFAYLFITKTSRIFSRAVFVQMWIIGIGMIYIARIWWKTIVQKRLENKKYLQSLIVISSSDRIKEIITSIKEQKYTGYYVSGIILSDLKNVDKNFLGIPVVADQNDAIEYLQAHVVDEVFIDLPEYSKWRNELVDACNEMGITIHLNIGAANLSGRNTLVEKFADHMVITTSISFADPRQLMVKRIMDIIGGIIGLGLTAIIMIIFGPIIFIQSPGSIFFSQERVGRNGRKFKIYKFRSMYLNAEERKKELMSQNKMQGFMFKIDDDPRIIPIGKFMRKTSLDEFPQFWNVLKGDMSLVGTRPPTVDEYEQYETHHKARLAAKPGLTGMWQVSGRSDIIDFEEVMALDKKYITEWNIGIDFRILLQTVRIVITGKGSV